MAKIAPEMVWDDESRCWNGPVPVWPFDRERPPLLDDYLQGRFLLAKVVYAEGFPMDAPRVIPVDPVPDPMHRSLHTWHVNPDGSLCLLRSASDWDGTGTAADLVIKASGWHLEYRLMSDERIECMTDDGIVNDEILDELLRP